MDNVFLKIDFCPRQAADWFVSDPYLLEEFMEAVLILHIELAPLDMRLERRDQRGAVCASDFQKADSFSCQIITVRHALRQCDNPPAPHDGHTLFGLLCDGVIQ